MNSSDGDGAGAQPEDRHWPARAVAVAGERIRDGLESVPGPVVFGTLEFPGGDGGRTRGRLDHDVGVGAQIVIPGGPGARAGRGGDDEPVVAVAQRQGRVDAFQSGAGAGGVDQHEPVAPAADPAAAGPELRDHTGVEVIHGSSLSLWVSGVGALDAQGGGV